MINQARLDVTSLTLLGVEVQIEVIPQKSHEIQTAILSLVSVPFSLFGNEVFITVAWIYVHFISVAGDSAIT